MRFRDVAYRDAIYQTNVWARGVSLISVFADDDFASIGTKHRIPVWNRQTADGEVLFVDTRGPGLCVSRRSGRVRIYQTGHDIGLPHGRRAPRIVDVSRAPMSALVRMDRLGRVLASDRDGPGARAMSDAVTTAMWGHFAERVSHVVGAPVRHDTLAHLGVDLVGRAHPLLATVGIESLALPRAVSRMCMASSIDDAARRLFGARSAQYCDGVAAALARGDDAWFWLELAVLAKPYLGHEDRAALLERSAASCAPARWRDAYVLVLGTELSAWHQRVGEWLSHAVPEDVAAFFGAYTPGADPVHELLFGAHLLAEHAFAVGEFTETGFPEWLEVTRMRARAWAALDETCRSCVTFDRVGGAATVAYATASA